MPSRDFRAGELSMPEDLGKQPRKDILSWGLPSNLD